MTARARISAAVALLAMMLAGALFGGGDQTDFGADSYGRMGWGHKAAFDALAELGVPVERSFASPRDLAVPKSVWWIAPHMLCDKLAPADADDPWAEPWDVAAWAQRGGTAVLFLPIEPLECSDELRIGGVKVPARWVDEVGRDLASDAFAFEVGDDDLDAEPRASEQFAVGGILTGARVLVDTALAHFTSAGAWQVSAELDGMPFVLERAFGEGRIVLVADASVVRNSALASGDNLPLLLDLALAYGAPAIDEREHGHSAALPTLAFLASSDAAPVFAGAGLLALVLVGSAHALPRRALADPPRDAPTLDGFVGSIAALYAQSDDRARALERYRELSLRRLQRALRLPSEWPRERVLEAARAHPRVDAASYRELAGRDANPSPARVRRVARALDLLIDEVSR